MNLLELFRFMVPYFAALPDEQVQQALDLAAAYRPACLDTARQDQAQVYYAAWLLYQRDLQIKAALPGAPVAPFGVKSEKEGDLSRTYGNAEGSDDPFGWWGEYSALADLCGGGAITVGHRHGSTCCGFI